MHFCLQIEGKFAEIAEVREYVCMLESGVPINIDFPAGGGGLGSGWRLVVGC